MSYNVIYENTILAKICSIYIKCARILEKMIKRLKSRRQHDLPSSVTGRVISRGLYFRKKFHGYNNLAKISEITVFGLNHIDVSV